MAYTLDAFAVDGYVDDPQPPLDECWPLILVAATWGATGGISSRFASKSRYAVGSTVIASWPVLRTSIESARKP